MPLESDSGDSNLRDDSEGGFDGAEVAGPAKVAAVAVSVAVPHIYLLRLFLLRLESSLDVLLRLSDTALACQLFSLLRRHNIRLIFWLQVFQWVIDQVSAPGPAQRNSLFIRISELSVLNIQNCAFLFHGIYSKQQRDVNSTSIYDVKSQGGFFSPISDPSNTF